MHEHRSVTCHGRVHVQDQDRLRQRRLARVAALRVRRGPRRRGALQLRDARPRQRPARQHQHHRHAG